MDFFKLKKNNTNALTEIYAGITIFFSMSYILAVNPDILSGAGMDRNAVFTATALAAAISTACMAFLSNYPFVLAPSISLSAYFAYGISKEYGWEIALCAVLTEGIIFILISFSDIRETVFNSIPQNFKYAVSVGIGFFISFVGLKNSGIIMSNKASFILLGDMISVSSCLTIIGVIIIGIMMYYRVKGSLLWGILIVYIMGIGCELIGWYQVTPETPSLIPTEIIQSPISVGSTNIITALKSVDFGIITIFDFVVIMVSFLFVDVFGTISIFAGISQKAEFTDDKGRLPNIKTAMLADAVGTFVGAILGTSTVTTSVESAVGTAVGGRTGLTALTTAFLFFISIFFFPIFASIPKFATAPALIIAGLYMIDTIIKINFSDFTESIPAFFIIIVIPFANSVVYGLTLGILSYIVLKVLTGRKKDVNIVMYIIAVIFFVKLFLY